MKVRVTLELEVPPDFTEYQAVTRMMEWVHTTAVPGPMAGLIPPNVQVVRVEREVSRWEPFPSEKGKILDFPSPKRGE